VGKWVTNLCQARDWVEIMGSMDNDNLVVMQAVIWVGAFF
jgi:hypothetical protein